MTKYIKNYELLSNDNPYKEGILEYHLIKFVLDNIALSQVSTSSKNIELIDLIDYLIEHNIEAPINPHNNILEYALTLAKFHNLIAHKNTEEIKRNTQFGIYLEEDMKKVDIPLSVSLLLSKMKNKESALNLRIANAMNTTFKYMLGIPSIENDNNEIYVSNIHLNRNENKNFRIKVTEKKYYEYGSYDLDTRGILHHIGDQVSYMYAAYKYGNLCVLTKGECGALIVLKRTIGCDYGFNDFDYISGVKYGYTAVYSKSELINDDREDCLLNNKENTQFCENFWHNSTFKKYARRQYDIMSFKDMSNKMYNSFHTTLNKFPVEKDVCLNILSLIEERIKTFLDNKDWDIADAFDFINHLLYFKNIEDMSLKVTGQNLKEINDKMINESSFFYKTLVSKLHCEIINPPQNKKLGFFLKAGDNTLPVKEISLLSIIYNFLSDQKTLLLRNINETKLSWRKKLDIENRTLQEKFEEDFASYVYNHFTQDFESYQKDAFKYYCANNRKEFVVSEVIDMQNEYRIFVINGKVAATSPCFRNTVPLNAWRTGVFDPRLCDGHNATFTFHNKQSRSRVAKYAKFARNFCRELRESNPHAKSFVLDVAWSDTYQDVVAIEINSITWSGAYQINMFRLCAAIAGKKYKPSHMEDFLNSIEREKQIIINKDWEEAIRDNEYLENDKIINYSEENEEEDCLEWDEVIKEVSNKHVDETVKSMTESEPKIL